MWEKKVYFLVFCSYLNQQYKSEDLETWNTYHKGFSFLAILQLITIPNNLILARKQEANQIDTHKDFCGWNFKKEMSLFLNFVWF